MYSSWHVGLLAVLSRHSTQSLADEMIAGHSFLSHSELSSKLHLNADNAITIRARNAENYSATATAGANGDYKEASISSRPETWLTTHFLFSSSTYLGYGLLQSALDSG
jgi:hypothetical protein